MLRFKTLRRLVNPANRQTSNPKSGQHLPESLYMRDDLCLAFAMGQKVRTVVGGTVEDLGSRVKGLGERDKERERLRAGKRERERERERKK